MRLLYSLLLLPFLSSGITAQDYIDTLIRGDDTVIVVDHTRLPAKLPSINNLTEEQQAAFTERYGIHLVRVVDQPNTYRWSDGNKTITVPAGLPVQVFRQDDAEGNPVAYCIGAIDPSDDLPSKTTFGLFRSVRSLEAGQ